MVWGVALEGHEFDLLDWKESLCLPFDPWVETQSRDGATHYLLRSGAFDELESAVEVRQRATPMIERLSGAMALSRGSRPVTVGHIVEFGGDGSIRRHLAVAAASVTARSRASAVGLAVKSNQPVMAVKVQSEVQGWNALAESDASGEFKTRADLVGDLLVQLNRCDNWYDIYKTMELAEKLAGKIDHLRRLLPDRKSYDSARHTANFYRHARATWPENPASLDEARQMAFLAAKLMLDREVE